MGGKGSGAKPREYAAEIVARIRGMYESGMTISEIQQQVTGVKVQNVLGRYGIPRRRPVKRDQRGPRNAMWRGDAAGYQALHLRVEAARGKPSICEWCGASDVRMEWANVSGQYTDVSDYARLCVSCHRVYDAGRRRATGRRTAPDRKKVMPNV